MPTAPSTSNEVGFEAFVLDAFDNKDFMREYDRLRGSHLGPGHSPILLLIDKTTGFRKRELERFIADMLDLWGRVR